MLLQYAQTKELCMRTTSYITTKKGALQVDHDHTHNTHTHPTQEPHTTHNNNCARHYPHAHINHALSMCRVRGILCSIILCANMTLKGTIIEIKTIAHLPFPLNEKTLVAFDIDNTLIEPENEIGSDQWFSAAIDYLTNQGLSFKHAFSIIQPQNIYFQQKARVKPVEPAIVTYIRTLQKHNIPTIALTARSKSLQDITFKQLESVGINFNLHPYKNISIALNSKKYSVDIKKGIIFCDNKNKGEVLKVFLNLTRSTPSSIIMVDDKRDHLKEVEVELKKLGIHFFGYRYGYLDEKIKHFRFDKQMITVSLNHIVKPNHYSPSAQ
jgi:hypothetical protein